MELKRNEILLCIYFCLFLLRVSILIQAPPTTEKVDNPTFQVVDRTDDYSNFNHPRDSIIDKVLMTVYTIFTDESQGSGFLYNESGIIVTNAHVVEDAINVIVKSSTGKEIPGRVIGYSFHTDVAIISAPDLVGSKPFPIDKSDITEVGQHVIALGSPLGVKNTVTKGYITGINRNLNVLTGSSLYTGLYQMTASLEPGSSGGPLIDSTTGNTIIIIIIPTGTKTLGKVITINTWMIGTNTSMMIGNLK